MPHLLDLPPEIHCLVAEEVAIGDEPDTWDCKSLQSLRLACKALYGASVDIFGIAFFVKRNHVVSRYSIGELLTITEHPAFDIVVCASEGGSSFGWEKLAVGKDAFYSNSHTLRQTLEAADFEA
ncbi:hypothetical protein D6D15_05463 [Aureobasidium pullulans]|uniref:Uncharacterized protein n=1 Tax=Aureobasidium pullulans TaxID=5580 RepID=A0A4S9B8D9_AURPU|nr:hypothetical protein D6D15_05463 [Aureobasidium pullulans]